MAHSSAPHDGALSPGERQRMDELVQQFLGAWNAGQQPQIEDYLSQMVQALREAFFRELLRREFALRRKGGEDILVDDYLRRFPPYVHLVQSFFAQEETGLSERSAGLGPSVSSLSPSPAAAPGTAKAPTHWGRYRVTGILGEGAFGIAYRGRDDELQRDADGTLAVGLLYGPSGCGKSSLVKAGLLPRRGRAELRLAECAALWTSKPESRHLPAWWEWLIIRTLVPRKDWTAPQRRMMVKAAGHHLARGFVLLAVVLLLGYGLFEGLTYLAARVRVEALTSAETAEVPRLVRELGPHRRWADALLRQPLAEDAPDRQRLHTALALAPVDPGQVDFLLERLLGATPEVFPVLRDALIPYQADIQDRLWRVVEDEAAGARRLRASAALAASVPGFRGRAGIVEARDRSARSTRGFFRLTPKVFPWEVDAAGRECVVVGNASWVLRIKRIKPGVERGGGAHDVNLSDPAPRNPGTPCRPRVSLFGSPRRCSPGKLTRQAVNV